MIPSSISYAFLSTLFLVFVRISAFFMVAPVFASPQFLIRVKMFLSIFLSLAIAQTLEPVNWLSDTSSSMLYIAMMAKEIAIGLVLGFIGRLIMAGLDFGSSLMGMTAGLAMANIFDPQTQSQNTLVASLFSLVFMVIFFVLDYHHQVIMLLAKSFQLVPLQVLTINQSVLSYVTSIMSGIFEVALRLSAPILVCVTLSNLVLGLVGRAAPQMNIFFNISFALNLGIAFAILWLAQPFFLRSVMDVWSAIFHQTLAVMKLLKSG